MHGLVALFLAVIVFAIILLFVGLAALRVLIIVTRTIVALIILMAIVGLPVVAIVLVVLMVVVILVATMLLVAQFTATRSKMMSRLLFFWLPFALDNLLKSARCFVSCLTLLKQSDELEQVRGHHLVCIRELKLMRLGLREEELLNLLLHCGYFHHSTELATIEIADEVYSPPHEPVHQHESGLLGGTKPVNQLVVDIGEPGDGLKVIPDAFVEVRLCMVCVGGTLLCDAICPFSQTYMLKTLTLQVKQCWTIVLPSIQELSQNL